MIFDNVNNLPEVADLESIYGAQLCKNYPELAGMNIKTYTDKQGTGFIKKWDNRNDSPYTSNHIVNEIMRSEDVYNQCGFTSEEEYAIIAHELGHIVAGKRGEKSMDNLQEELNADQMAVSLGLKDYMASAIRKMIDLNINPNNKAEMESRIESLNKASSNI